MHLLVGVPNVDRAEITFKKVRPAEPDRVNTRVGNNAFWLPDSLVTRDGLSRQAFYDLHLMTHYLETRHGKNLAHC